MKKEYITPECFSIVTDNPIMVSNSEEEVTYNIGAKENGGFFDEEPFGSLWDEEPVEDPFSIDDY